MDRTKAIILSITILIATGLVISKIDQGAELHAPLPDCDKEFINDLILPDISDISSIEMYECHSRNGQSYICTDKHIIEELVRLISTASPICTNSKVTGDYFISIKCGADETVSLSGYLSLIDANKSYLEVPGKGAYSADISLYFIVGDLIAED